MDVRPNGVLLEETERKLESPLGAPRITEQQRRHGRSGRYIHDPMTQGYRPGKGCRSSGTMPRKLPRGPGPFLAVSHYTLWPHGHNPPHTFYAPWPSGQLGAGIVHGSRVCMCIAHGKQCRSSFTASWYLSCGNTSILAVRARSPFSGSALEPDIDPPRPRFCVEVLPKPCWSTLLRGQTPTCSVA